MKREVFAKMPHPIEGDFEGNTWGLDGYVWLGFSRIGSTGKEKPCSNGKVSKVEHGLYLS